jgi:hypothetical protein
MSSSRPGQLLLASVATKLKAARRVEGLAGEPFPQ